MTTSHFGGKKAAPFVKGGGRSKSHPNDAKGRKRKAALKAVAKAKGGDYSNVDLAFWDKEPRGKDGKWVGYGNPHSYVPEMGARGPAEFKYLQAKNTLAQAVLSDNHRAISKAQRKVGEAHIAFLQEKNRGEGTSVANAVAAATTDEAIAARAGERDLLASQAAAKKAKRKAARKALADSARAVSDALGGM